MNSRLLLDLLAPRRSARRSREGGFALALALFVAITVLLGWLALANRSNASRLGAALQDENREARIAAESGLSTVISELNRPRNRMLLARGQNLQDWSNPVSDSSPLINPCANSNVTSAPKLVKPSPLIAKLGQGSYIDLPSTPASNDRLERQYRVVGFRLKNADRSSGNNYNPSLINLRLPSTSNPKQGIGYAELIVEGKVSKNGKDSAIARVSQEFQVVPKCCGRSFRGPGDPTAPPDPATGIRPGLYGDDNRYCFDDFPPLLVGTGNSGSRDAGGVYNLNNSTPEVRNQDNPSVRPVQILCYTETGSCQGSGSVDQVPVVPSNRQVPTVPVLSETGVPCDDEDLQCIQKGIAKAKSSGFSARAIELFNDRSNGAKNNSATNRYAKDYIRVNSSGNVEICNKTYSPNGRNASTPKDFDTTDTIVRDSCEPMMGTGDSRKDVCAKQVIDGFVSYHCRISTIFVNDFDATDDIDAAGVQGVRQNNTLFIDSSRAPIYLYVNEDWAATSPSTQALQQMRANFVDPAEYQPVFTVGGYNDGQIQHVYCGSRNGQSPRDGTNACVTPAPDKISTRAAIVSACKRDFDTRLNSVIDLCDKEKRANAVNAVIGDDGFARGLFMFMPKSKVDLAGDPNLNDLGGDSAQGKPQMASAVWADQFRFTRQSTELYVPGPNAEFFGLETSYDDRYSPRFGFDYVARSITGSSLFNLRF